MGVGVDFTLVKPEGCPSRGAWTAASLGCEVCVGCSTSGGGRREGSNGGIPLVTGVGEGVTTCGGEGAAEAEMGAWSWWGEVVSVTWEVWGTTGAVEAERGE